MYVCSSFNQCHVLTCAVIPRVVELEYLVHDLATKELPEMLKKPFRTPFRTPFDNKPGEIDDSEPQPKKRRISNDQKQATPQTKSRLVFKMPGISSVPRRPLSAVENLAVASEPAASNKDDSGRYYTVLWYVNYG